MAGEERDPGGASLVRVVDLLLLLRLLPILVQRNVPSRSHRKSRKRRQTMDSERPKWCVRGPGGTRVRTLYAQKDESPSPTLVGSETWMATSSSGLGGGMASLIVLKMEI